MNYKESMPKCSDKLYDYVIVTHIPVFYKINLYNKLAEKLSIFVIFIASNTQEKRANDFVALNQAKFKYKVLTVDNFQNRKVLGNIKSLRKLFKTLNYKSLLVSGWDLPEFWYLIFTNRKCKNCLALESTINESKTTGLQGFIKKIFLSRISKVFASGSLHSELLNKLGYQGEIKLTRGVGIINKPIIESFDRKYSRKFLYVGRLSKVKNLETLVSVFNKLDDCSLTIVGDGDQKEYLQSISKSNIVFKPAIDNKDLRKEFLNNDIFILPSSIEPWGLVVEEAFYFGMPVIISKNCGARDIVNDGENGYWIDPNNQTSIRNLVLDINEYKYTELVKAVEKFSINIKDNNQIGTYI